MRLAGNIATAMIIAPIRFYRFFISPWLGVNCRFAPSCSQYAIEAIRLHGAAKGGVMAARRIARCHPLGGSGFDPVPGAPVPGAPVPKKCNHKSKGTI